VIIASRVSYVGGSITSISVFGTASWWSATNLVKAAVSVVRKPYWVARLRI